MPPPPPPPPPPPVPPPYGMPPSYGAPYGSPVRPAYAGWGNRVGATLVDGLVQIPFLLPGYIALIAGGRTNSEGTTSNGGLAGLGVFLVFAGLIGYYVIYCRQLGNTGQTWGRKALGYKVVDKTTLQPIGAGRAFGRIFAKILDGLPCYLGYLWPLWDQEKQTFSDKVMNTIAVKA